MSQISKRTRFEIFKRDHFKCAYCGSTPPAVVLHVDHIHPRSKGGDNSRGNLITACSDCNLGKSDKLLSDVPEAQQERDELIKEKEEQLKAFRLMKKRIRKREDDDIKEIELVFCRFYKGQEFTETFRTSIRSNFLKNLDAMTLVENMEKACSRKVSPPDQAIKYFCGINWNMIKGKGRES